MVLVKCKTWSWILVIHSCVYRSTHVYCICHIKTILSEFWNQASRITLICFFSHTITFFGAYLSGHMVKNGMSYHTYTFPNPTNPFFFGSGERSRTMALYAKNGRKILKGNKYHNFLEISLPSEVCTTRYFQLLPIWQLHSRKKVLNILK